MELGWIRIVVQLFRIICQSSKIHMLIIMSLDHYFQMKKAFKNNYLQKKEQISNTMENKISV